MVDTKTPPEDVAVISVSMTLEAGEGLEALYSNLVQIRAGEHDFVMDFGQIAPPSPEEAERIKAAGGVLKGPVRSRVILPISLLPRLIKALETLLDKHTKSMKSGPQEG